MRRRSLVPLVAIVAGIGTACSGGDDESSSTVEVATPTAAATTPATTAPPATTPAPTTAPPTTNPPTSAPMTTAPPTTVPASTTPDTTEPADPLAAVAASALITLEDFASGWSEEPADPESDDDDEATDIVADCAGIDPALIGNDLLGTSRVEAGFTTVDESFSVDHSVGFAADEATAAAAFVAISDPDVPGCYGDAVLQFFEQQMNSDDPADTLPPGLEVGEATTAVGDLSGFTLRSEVYWFHVEYPLTLGDQTFDQHADFVFLRNGAALSQVMLTGFGQPFPAEDVQGIVELADAKLAAIA
jgi:hypothetical protein